MALVGVIFLFLVAGAIVIFAFRDWVCHFVVRQSYVFVSFSILSLSRLLITMPMKPWKRISWLVMERVG